MDNDETPIDYKSLYDSVDKENISLRMFIIKMRNEHSDRFQQIKNFLTDPDTSVIIHTIGLIFALFVVPFVGMVASLRKGKTNER